MSARFLLTATAADDLFDLWRYLAERESEKAADRVLARIHDACERLADFPGMGHYREDLADRTLRFWLAGSHLIVYRWQVDPILVIRVLHGARDLAAFLSNPERRLDEPREG